MRLRLFNLLCILLGGLFLYIGINAISWGYIDRVRQAGCGFLLSGLFLTFAGLSYTIVNAEDGSFLSRYSFEKWTSRWKAVSFAVLIVVTMFSLSLVTIGNWYR